MKGTMYIIYSYIQYIAQQSLIVNMELAEPSSVILGLSWILFIQRKRKLARLRRGWDTALSTYLWEQCTHFRQEPFVLIPVPLCSLRDIFLSVMPLLPWLEDFAACLHGAFSCMGKRPGRKNSTSIENRPHHNYSCNRAHHHPQRAWTLAPWSVSQAGPFLGSWLLPTTLKNCQRIYMFWC